MLCLYLTMTGLKHGVCVMDLDRSMVSSFCEFSAHGVAILPMSSPPAHPCLALFNPGSCSMDPVWKVGTPGTPGTLFLNVTFRFLESSGQS